MGLNESRPVVDVIPDNRKVFVNIESCHRHPSTGTYTVYVIAVRYRRWQWRVGRRFRDVVSLDRRLSSSIANYPQRFVRPRKKLFGKLHPGFIEQRRAELQVFLQKLADDDEVFDRWEFRQFFDSSVMSFNPKFGIKFKEGYLRKCSGGYRAKFSQRTGDMFSMWRKRWVVLTDTGIVYYRSHKDPKPLGYLQVDSTLSCSPIGHLLRLENATRTLTVRASSAVEVHEWIQAFNACFGEIPRRTLSMNGSSFPVRGETNLRFYLGGKETMAAMATAMLLAREEIFIAGWWLTPKVYLTRPPDAPLRLDQLLQFKAAAGVNIYILLYQEVDFAMANASMQSKGFLKNLHPNIHIIRHPNKFRGGSKALLWSHHDKIVVIDQNLAFVGGIDMAWGRWDDNTHCISDPDGLIWPGEDYYNPGTGSLMPTRSHASVHSQSRVMRSVSSSSVSTAELHGPVFARSSLRREGSATVTAVASYGSKQVMMTSNSTTVVASRQEIIVYQAETKESQETQFRNELDSISSAEDIFARFTNDHEVEDGSDGENSHEVEPETEEERAVRREVEAQAIGGQTIGWDSIREDDQDARSVVAAGPSSPRALPKRELGSFSSFRDYVKQSTLAAVESLGKGVEELIDEFNRPKASIPLRDLYPRMPWHDVHSSVTGTAARDVALHFIQRWNHHRISKNNIGEPILVPATDRPFFGECARCNYPLNEMMQACSCCGLDLGEPAACALPLKDVQHTPAEELSYIEFTCQFSESLGIRVTGEGPCVVNYVHLPAASFVRGHLDWSHGPHAKELLDSTPLVPAIGDLVISINSSITALANFSALQKLVLTAPTPITVQFRRYLHPLEEIVAAADEYVSKMNKNRASTKVRPSIILEAIHAEEDVKDPLDAEPIIVQASENEPTVSVPWKQNFVDAFQKFALHSETAAPALTATFLASGALSEDVEARAPEPGETELIYEVRQRLVQSAFDLDVRLNIDLLLAAPQFRNMLPDHHSIPGSCNVQVLRSVGLWSVGAPKESSIASTYCAAIMNARHFIYIENQFFVSATTGAEVKNDVSKWLLERLVMAAQHRQTFRLMIVLPLHPEGDFLSDRQVQVVMHYQYRTICRGVQSLIAQFRRKCPWVVNTEDYISFYSLRTWGTMNGKVVAEQIYIHDKIMIIDDRAMIIGSANINDRSMLGDRDSEIALFIEDTKFVRSQMNGHDWEAGENIRNIRMRLWRKHLGNPTAPIEDPICEFSYRDTWMATAELNTHLFEVAIDKAASVYRCKSKSQLVAAAKAQGWPNASDKEVIEILTQIQGFLVFHPLDFCENENWALGATEFFVPTDLFV